MSDSGIGLRAIKKQMTREDIADAALQLTLDQGFENVTIEEIAKLAFVSPRTFSNYFACKEEAVVSAGVRFWTELVGDLSGRPPDEPPLEAIRDLLTDAVSGPGRERLQISAQKLQLSSRYPGLRPYEMAAYDQLEIQLRTVIADRVGADVGTDLDPWLIAATAVAAMKAAMGLWLTTGARPEDLPGLVHDSFDGLINGVERRLTPDPRAAVES